MRRVHKLLGQASLRFILFAFLIMGFSCPTYGADGDGPHWGFSAAGGWGIGDAPSLYAFSALPSVGWQMHPLWDFELEGNISYYPVKRSGNIYALGANVNVLFKPFQFKNGISPFTIVGGGLAYNNGNGRLNLIGDSHLGGVLQAGGGILFPVGSNWRMRLECRILHISDPFEYHDGFETVSFLLGISY